VPPGALSVAIVVAMPGGPQHERTRWKHLRPTVDQKLDWLIK